MKLRKLGNLLGGRVWEKVFVMATGVLVLGTAALGTPVSAAEIVERFEAVGPVMGASDPVCDNAQVSQEIKAASGCNGNSGVELPNVVTSIINGVIAILGLLAVIMIVVGGYKYMTAAGDAGKLAAAKNTLLYACIGLIICALAFMIVNFVIVNIIGGNPPS